MWASPAFIKDRPFYRDKKFANLTEGPSWKSATSSFLSRCGILSRVGTVLVFSVFFGFRVFELFIRVLGRGFGPDLLREKS